MSFSASAGAPCQNALDSVGSGIGASLRAVDCAAGEMAQAAFARLFADGGALTLTLQVLLTIVIALIGYGLITGRVRIGLSSLAPRLFTIVAVIIFATSWIAFQSVFWNLAVLAPDQIAGILMGTQGSATIIFADKLDVVMLSLMEASGGDGMAETTSVFSPPGLLWTGGTMLLLGTVGVLATCKIALAVLMALGPVFIVLALFSGTRGLFAGWLKAAVLMALAPLFAVIAGSLMLELAIPVLAELAATPGQIDVRPAMAFFMIGAVHLALMVMVMKVASTLVSNWSVFGLTNNDRTNSDWANTNRSDDVRPAQSTYSSVPSAQFTTTTAQDRAAITTPSPARDIRLAANDTAGTAAVRREAAIISGAASASGQTGTSTISRARGIGSRYKSAPIRSTEKNPL